MHTLSGQEILHIWEVGLGQHPLDRALTILATAFPDVSHKQLIVLSIGQRDECLFAIRARTFGWQLVSFVLCPYCQEQLELALDLATDLHITPDAMPATYTNQIQSLNTDDYAVHFHLPNSLDLAAIVNAGTVANAHRLLLQRSIVDVQHAGKDVPVDTLPESLISALTTQMDIDDPFATVNIGLDCIACHAHVPVLFDIVTFFWTEIAAQAKRLLQEVHTLAKAYGWQEREILSMSATRRQLYLEMVS